MTKEELHKIILDKFNSDGTGWLVLEMNHSRGHRYQQKYEVILSRLMKDGFYFPNHDTDEIMININNAYRKTEIL